MDLMDLFITDGLSTTFMESMYHNIPTICIFNKYMMMNISDKEITIATNDPVNIVHQLTTWAISNGIELPHLTIKEQSLEDLFLSWTQKQP